MRFYMAVLLHRGTRMHVVFPALRPRLALLTHVLHELDRLEGQTQPAAGEASKQQGVFDGCTPAQRVDVDCR